jgi:hypothetical protein
VVPDGGLAKFHAQLPPDREPTRSCPTPDAPEVSEVTTQSATALPFGCPHVTALPTATLVGIPFDCTQVSGVVVRSPVQTAAVLPWVFGAALPMATQCEPEHAIPVTDVAPVGNVDS